MLKATRSTNFAASRFWNKKSVQLSGAVFFAIMLPMIVLAMFYANFSESSSAQLTAAGVTVAALLSVFLLRTVAVYPGIRGAYFVLPVVLGVYGLTFLIFLLFRLDYSRALMLSARGAMLM